VATAGQADILISHINQCN